MGEDEELSKAMELSKKEIYEAFHGEDCDLAFQRRPSLSSSTSASSHERMPSKALRGPEMGDDEGIPKNLDPRFQPREKKKATLKPATLNDMLGRDPGAGARPALKGSIFRQRGR